MAIMLVAVKVADYDTWLGTFEANGEVRKTFGCTGTHYFRNLEDRDEVIINLQWDTQENAERFLASDELKRTMQDAGVQGPPEVRFLEDGGRTPS